MSTATTITTPLRARSAWQALARHHQQIVGVHLRELFAGDRDRGERLVAEGAGLYLDYSKNRITDETVALLVALAEESGVSARTEAMFRGERINVTEDRSVLHVALRMPRGESLVVDGVEVVADSGEGRWTSIAAIDVGVPAPTLTTALYSRFGSRGLDQFADKLLSAMRKEFGGHAEKQA